MQADVLYLVNPPSGPSPRCHPERRHHAKGLCHSCYVASLRGANLGRKADCHPERLHRAKGLCNTCYQSRLRVKPHMIEKIRQYQKRFNDGGGNWKSFLKRKYHLTVEQYQKILAAQNAVCAICLMPANGRRLAVDHDHSSGVVRGILCHNCNLLLGQLEKLKGKPSRLRAYLERHGLLELVER